MLLKVGIDSNLSLFFCFFLDNLKGIAIQQHCPSQLEKVAYTESEKDSTSN